MNKKDKIKKVIMIIVMAAGSGYFMYSGFSELYMKTSLSQEINSSK
jgi:hypothetical protein